MPGIGARTMLIVGALLASAAMTAPVLLAQQTTTATAASSPTITDAKTLKAIAGFQAVAQDQTARAAAYRASAATYTRRAAAYANLAPTAATAAPTAVAANAQRARIQSEARDIAAIGEQLARRADAAAASASLQVTQLQQRAALPHTP